MNKLFYVLLFSGLILLFTSATLYVSGTPGAKTGSPSDGNNCTQCHGGTPQSATGWISSTIPAAGYTPEETYQITLTGTHVGVSKFGFEITCEDNANSKVGMFSISNTTETQLANGSAAVTHTNDGTSPINDEKSWTFDWIAPVTGSGEVSFYAALNAANGNGATSGDVIYLTSESFSEFVTGINNTNTSFKVFPNPTTEYIFINGVSANTKFNIIDLNGRIIKSFELVTSDERINISDINNGVYFLQSDSKDIKNQKIVIL